MQASVNIHNASVIGEAWNADSQGLAWSQGDNQRGIRGHWQHKDHFLSVLLREVILHADLESLPHQWTENFTCPLAQSGT